MALDFIGKNKPLQRLHHGQHIVAWCIIYPFFWWIIFRFLLIYLFFTWENEYSIIVLGNRFLGMKLSYYIALLGILFFTWGTLSLIKGWDHSPDIARQVASRVYRTTMYIMLIIMLSLWLWFAYKIHTTHNNMESAMQQAAAGELRRFYLAATDEIWKPLAVFEPGSTFPPTVERIRMRMGEWDFGRELAERNGRLEHGDIYPTPGFVYYKGVLPDKTIPVVWTPRYSIPGKRMAIFSNGNIKSFSEEEFYELLKKHGITEWVEIKNR